MSSTRITRRTGALVAVAAACALFVGAAPATANGGPVWDDTPPVAAGPANAPYTPDDLATLDRINALPQNAAPADIAAAIYPNDDAEQQIVLDALAVGPSSYPDPATLPTDNPDPSVIDHGKVPTDNSADLSAWAPPGYGSFCRIPVVRNLIPACSNGRWEIRQVKIMRCIVGHSPYVGFFGMPKLVYWANKCARSSWQNW
ncbi:hypothetical protein ACWCXH_34190 [Kitasatospora sp. NPDC001660]